MRAECNHISSIPYFIMLRGEFTLIHIFLLEEGHKVFFFKDQCLLFFYSFFSSNVLVIPGDYIHYLLFEVVTPLEGHVVAPPPPFTPMIYQLAGDAVLEVKFFILFRLFNLNLSIRLVT